jgi:hypothetical protein
MPGLFEGEEIAIWFAIAKIEGESTLVMRPQNRAIRVEEPNLRQFDSEAGGEGETGAALLFGNGRYFFAEEVNNDNLHNFRLCVHFESYTC